MSVRAKFFFWTKHPTAPRPVCKLKFVHCGPVENILFGCKIFTPACSPILEIYKLSVTKFCKKFANVRSELLFTNISDWMWKKCLYKPSSIALYLFHGGTKNETFKSSRKVIQGRGEDIILLNRIGDPIKVWEHLFPNSKIESFDDFWH